jgi:hypothetical protein
MGVDSTGEMVVSRRVESSITTSSTILQTQAFIGNQRLTLIDHIYIFKLQN